MPIRFDAPAKGGMHFGEPEPISAPHKGLWETLNTPLTTAPSEVATHVFDPVVANRAIFVVDITST